MSRAAAAIIDLQALRHNLEVIRKRAGDSRVMAVIKANAYGHGIAAAARGLAKADAFAVACLEEALAVRAAGRDQPVVLLEGVFAAHELAQAARHNFEVVVHSAEQLAMLEAFSRPDSLRLWLKIDTGMNRLGFHTAEAHEAWRRLKATGVACGEIGLMTHLARADEIDNTHTRGQLRLFEEVTSGWPGERSIANSAATLAWPASHADWVRPGLVLYGVSPFTGRTGSEEGVLPAMSMHTRLIAVKNLECGQSVGYGGSFVAPRNMRLGIAAIGYGDGYPCHAVEGTKVLVNGQPADLTGRVSMDMISLDLSDQPGATVGDPVILWGPEQPVELLANAAGTIAWELLCGVTQRVSYTLAEGYHEVEEREARSQAS